MPSLIEIVNSIDWKMSKADLKNSFDYLDFIGDHPTLNAIGFSLRIHDALTAMVCYFVQKVFSEKLAAVQFAIFQEPPPPELLSSVYSKLFDELSGNFGEPKRSEDKYQVWVRPKSVEILSVQDGKIGLRHGHPDLDIVSKVAS